MNHSALVRFFWAFADFDSHLHDLIERQRTFVQAVRQRLALEVFHDEITGAALLADVIKMADAGVA